MGVSLTQQIGLLIFRDDRTIAGSAEPGISGNDNYPLMISRITWGIKGGDHDGPAKRFEDVNPAA